MDSPVVLVNRFTVYGSPEEFEKAFAETSAYFREQDGFVGYTLLGHTVNPGGYVNIAHWRDEASLRRALSRPEFGRHQAALRELSTSEPELYTCRQSLAVRP